VPGSQGGKKRKKKKGPKTSGEIKPVDLLPLYKGNAGFHSYYSRIGYLRKTEISNQSTKKGRWLTVLGREGRAICGAFEEKNYSTAPPKG